MQEFPIRDLDVYKRQVPLRLELNDTRDDYIRLTDEGVADFTAGVTFENYVTDTAENYENLSLVVKTTENLRALGDMGAENNSSFGLSLIHIYG